MRAMLAAMIFVAAGASAHAQLTKSSPPGVTPKQVTTVPVRPAPQTPADGANAMTQAERLALQSDLAWVGDYNGTISGEASERMIAAIKQFQKAKGGKQTGVLSAQERSVLAQTARRRQEQVGWKMVTDPGTGVQLGIPAKLVPQQTSDAGGAKWSSSGGAIEVLLTRRKQAGPTTAGLADREKKEPGRSVSYTAVKPDFFVLSGLQGPKKFYLRGTFRGDEVRILTILYDPATENTVGPVVIAMSSAFNPFPAGGQAGAPPARKSVEYSTGVVVSEDGAIIADREATEGCLAITIGGFGNADRVAEDGDRGLALLRIYGARGLKPLNLAGGAGVSAVDIVGIADPQAQGGRSAVSSVKAEGTQVGGGGDSALSPSPPPGFSGAAALDGGGRFAGLALLKPLVVAGPANAAATAQAALVRPETVRDFLKKHRVDAAGSSTGARGAVVRVICVRK